MFLKWTANYKGPWTEIHYIRKYFQDGITSPQLVGFLNNLKVHRDTLPMDLFQD